MALGPKNLRASPESRDREETPLGLDLLLVLMLPVPAQIPVPLFPSRPIRGDHAAPAASTERRGQGSTAEGRGTGSSSGLNQTLLEVTQACVSRQVFHVLSNPCLDWPWKCFVSRARVVQRIPRQPHIPLSYPKAPNLNSGTRTSPQALPKPPNNFLPVPSCSQRSRSDSQELPGCCSSARDEL